MRSSAIIALACSLAACTRSGTADDMAVNLPPYSCPELSNYCDHALPAAPCAPTLADARATDCVPDGGVRTGIHPVLSADCGALRVLYVSLVDGSEDFYYDTASGALVAVVRQSASFGGSTVCDGGPATFTPPHCQPPVAFCG